MRFADHVEEKGEGLLAAAGEMGLEGVVGKRADGPYRSGRSADWVKVRLDRSGDFAVVGYTKPDGARTGFGALHLASWQNGGLVYEPGEIERTRTVRPTTEIPLGHHHRGS